MDASRKNKRTVTELRSIVPSDPASAEATDLGRTFWRTTPAASASLLPLLPTAIDDATFRLLADNAPTLCWVANGDGYIVWYNRRWHDYCGTTPEQMEGWGWQAVHDQDLLPEIMERWEAALAICQPFEMTFPLKGADGVFRPFLTRIQPMQDATGAVARWFGVNTEISSQVAAETALRIERDRSHSVLEGMSEGFVLLDHHFRVLDINSEGLRIDRRPIDAILGRTHWEVWPGTEDATQGQLYKRVMAERVPQSAEVHYKWEDGREEWIEIRADPHPEGIAIFYREVGERRRAEAKLRDSEAFTRLLLDSTSEAFYSVNREGVTTLCNQAFLDLLGFESREAVIGRKLHDVIHHSHPDGSHYPVDDCPIYRAASHGQAAYVDSELFFRLDGTGFPVTYRAEPILRDGELQGAICTFDDITERRAAEARQQFFLSLADRLRNLAEPRAVIAAAVEMLGRHLKVSRAGFGVVSEDQESVTYETDYVDGVAHLVGTFPLSLFGPDNIAELKRGATTKYADVSADFRTVDANFAAIETRAAMAVPLIREGRLRAALYLNHRDVRVWSAEEVALAQDVAARMWDALERARAEADLRELNASLERRVEERTAELQLAEAALRQSQKMEAVGQLTGGIAHDFNNMLAVVIGSLDLLRRRMGEGDARARRYVDAAADGARRAATLTQRLLAFSRQQPLQPEPVNLNKLVAGMSDLLRRSLGGDVRLETVLAGGLWRAHVDPNQLENVILNLAVNGRDAMPEGGCLTIETQNAHLDMYYATAELGLQAGQYVQVAVTDNGSGMPAEIIAKAFDPFFTTKEVGKGTGLGLSQVYGFVKQSGGHVKIYSEAGQGTTVKVYLPRLLGQDEEAPAGDVEPSIPLGDALEVVLVVEDEPAVRQFSVDALGELGYRVLEADGAATALRLLEAHPEILLLFTDVIMPDVNGRRLADEALKRRQDLKVLFTTGYTRNAVVHNGVLDPGVELIGKPFTIEELAAKVREVLDTP